MDAIEDYPELYQRRVVRVTYPNGDLDQAFAYFLPPDRCPGGLLVESGDWLEEIGNA